MKDEKDRICTSCYHIGKPVAQGAGSFFVDALIWLSFISLSILSSFFILILIPISWTVYHIAVYRKTTCPKCERLDMVSMTSRKGLEALKGPKWVVSYEAPEEQKKAKHVPLKKNRRGDDQ